MPLSITVRRESISDFRVEGSYACASDCHIYPYGFVINICSEYAIAFMGDSASILTPKQREYLKNGPDEDMTEAAERAMRSRIRERVEAGLRDFSILFEEWPEEEREKVFSNLRDDGLDGGVTDMLALVYSETKVADSFKNLLTRGVRGAERRAAGSDTLTVRTNFDPEIAATVNMQEAIEKYRREEYDEMTDAEKTSALRTLRRTGAVSPEELDESVEERMEEIRRRINEAKRNRAEYWREKQNRAGDS